MVSLVNRDHLDLVVIQDLEVTLDLLVIPDLLVELDHRDLKVSDVTCSPTEHVYEWNAVSLSSNSCTEFYKKQDLSWYQKKNIST